MCMTNHSTYVLQVNKFKEVIFRKKTEVPEMLKQVEKHPSYDMQGLYGVLHVGSLTLSTHAQ